MEAVADPEYSCNSRISASSHRAAKSVTARAWALRVFGFRMLAVKNSTNRRAASLSGENSFGSSRDPEITLDHYCPVELQGAGCK
jgi:hypothetical protein